ncbi:Metallo-dependent phosphatase [Pelomyxa schiedti]|nr:Metallo-dependent phosphatase [Pelomyxa schiedti]
MARGRVMIRGAVALGAFLTASIIVVCEIYWLSSGTSAGSGAHPQGFPPGPRVPGPRTTDTPARPSAGRFLEGPPAARDIYAVGDLHGDLAGAQRVLRALGLLRPRRARHGEGGRGGGGGGGQAAGPTGDWEWAGGDAVLVQMGDLVDRGNHSMEAFTRRWGCKGLSWKPRGMMMNLAGNLRYVSAGDTQAFGGAAARKKAFSAEGHYGKWVRSMMKAVVIEGDTVFVHGGLLPAVAELGVARVNRLINIELRKAAGDFDTNETVDESGYSEGFSWLLGNKGPMWNRDIAKGDCDSMHKSLKILGVSRMVLGHSFQERGVTSACNDSLWLIDVGISASFGSHTQAIKIKGNEVSIISGS